MWAKLARLSEVAAPSGHEAEATRLASEFLATFVQEVTIDALGNVLGYRRCGKENAPLLALDAHLDEVGILISSHEEGYAHILPVGGLDLRIMGAQPVRLSNGLRGVIGLLPPHVQSKEDMDGCLPLDKLYLDLGLSEDEIRRQAPVGTVGVFDVPFVDRGDTVMGKALDDRACFMMLLRALELVRDKQLNVDVVVVGAVQEELGLRGAITAAFGTAPDYAIAVDVKNAYTPDASKDATCTMGGGPVIAVGPGLTRSVSDTLIELAASKELPHEIEVLGGGVGTDSWAYQTSREGVPTGLLSLPLKYMHTPSEVLNKQDFEWGAQLLAAYMEAL